MKLFNLFNCTISSVFISLYDDNGFLLYLGRISDFKNYAKQYKKDWKVNLFDINITYLLPKKIFGEYGYIIHTDYVINFMKGE